MLERSPALAPARDDTSTTPSDLIWGAERIARLINRTPRAVWYMLDRGQIACAKKVGGRWCTSRSALLREFGGAA
jgi:hypothetical protein